MTREELINMRNKREKLEESKAQIDKNYLTSVVNNMITDILNIDNWNYSGNDLNDMISEYLRECYILDGITVKLQVIIEIDFSDCAIHMYSNIVGIANKDISFSKKSYDIKSLFVLNPSLAEIDPYKKSSNSPYVRNIHIIEHDFYNKLLEYLNDMFYTRMIVRTIPNDKLYINDELNLKSVIELS